MNLELRAKVTETGLGVIDINGYKYNHCKMSLTNLEDFDVLLPIFSDVLVGDCFVSTSWIVTCLDASKKPTQLVVRVDACDIIQLDDSELTTYLNSKVVGLFCSTDKCYLKTVGPDKKPFFSATIKIRNPFGDSFDMLIVSFGNQAKKMSTVKKQSIIECEVTVKRRRHEPGFEFAVCSVNVKKEG